MTSDDTRGSTDRLGLASAPGGLCVVQDLLNTAHIAGGRTPDLLDERTAAQSWIDASLRTWGEQTGRTPPRLTVSTGDLGALRELRSVVRAWLTGGDAGDRAQHLLAVDVSLHDKRLIYEPRGEGAEAVASLVHLELLLASHTGALARLKTCTNPDCGAAFYDMSRNGTRVWHDMKTCGNVANLRASRARRRGTAPTRSVGPSRS